MAACLAAACLAAACLAACGGRPAGRAPAVTDARGQAASGGCSASRYRMTVSPASVRPGQIATVSDNGPRSPAEASVANWGALGTTRSGPFVLLWNLAAIVPGFQRTPNLPAGSRVAMAGVGLRNRPFSIAVPPVPAGRYEIQFVLSTSRSGGPSVNRTLCASLHVTDGRP